MKRVIVVQDSWFNDSETVDAVLGRPALLASETGRSFTLREVPVTGIFRYPVVDDLLSTVALVDADTARALNGYLYGALEEVTLSAEDQALLGLDVDALFDAADATSGETHREFERIDVDNLFDIDSVDGDREETERARETVAGAWNFLLIALHDQNEHRAAVRQFSAAGIDGNNGYRIRPWWSTIGGSASLVRYLQVFFNAGLVFVAVGAAIIATNALVLSVLERTSEIGTMPLSGATRSRVALLITFETVLVVASAAIVGIVSGALAVGLLNAAEYTVTNQYIHVLFGGRPIIGIVTVHLVATHVAVALLLSLIVVLYPIRRSMVVSPREAMAA